MGAQALCRCSCGKDFDAGVEPQQAFGSDFDALYEIDYRPVRTPANVEALSYSVTIDQPLRGEPVRRGKLWYLLAEEKVELVDFALYVNGFSFNYELGTVSVVLNPFTLVRNCKFQETYSNRSLMDLKIFKLSLFTQSQCYYFGIRGGDDSEAEEERQRWVTEIARAVQLVTQSLYPPFSISVEPLDSVVATLRRLMAGYLLYYDGAGTATVVYCELHPHCDIKDHAKLAFYENELCQRLLMEIRVTVGTVCCEKVGVNCSCFCIDGHQFSSRTCAERKLWLRAISNIKVKLQNCAPTPSGEELRHYREAIAEHVESLRQAIEGLRPIEPLLDRLPPRRLTAAPVPVASAAPVVRPAAAPVACAAPMGASAPRRCHVNGDVALAPVPEESALISAPALPRAVAAMLSSDGGMGGELADSPTDLDGCTGGSGGPDEAEIAAESPIPDPTGCASYGCGVPGRVSAVGRRGWQPKVMPQPGDG